MVKRQDTLQRSNPQVQKKAKRNERIAPKITANTPVGICEDRLTAFGGLLALAKMFDLLDFEREFEKHYAAPKRLPNLGHYRMVNGILMLLFIGFQRLGHFAYLRGEDMLCKMFGAKTFNRLSDQIDTVANEFYEQILVIGYGKSENSANIFEIGPTLASHALSGVAAIGSGAEVALSNLLLLKQARHRQLADTIYAVAAAKFSAEMSQDTDVGNSRYVVGWKRTETDEEGKPPGTFLDQDEIAKLRGTWEKYGKPRIPIQSPVTLWPIVSKVRKAKGEVRLEDADLRLAAERLKPVEESEEEEDRSAAGF